MRDGESGKSIEEHPDQHLHRSPEETGETDSVAKSLGERPLEERNRHIFD